MMAPDSVFRISGIGAPPEVAVWCADLDDPTLSIDDCLEMLSDGERRQYGMLRLTIDRERFARRRALRRLLLAAELGVSPADLEFLAGIDGKPRLYPSALFFSSSTAEHLFLLAAVRGREVGVDIAPRTAPFGWTRIEAIAKALGCGLTIAPETLAGMDLSGWIECGFQPAPGFVATLLVAR